MVVPTVEGLRVVMMDLPWGLNVVDAGRLRRPHKVQMAFAALRGCYFVRSPKNVALSTCWKGRVASV